MAQHMIIDDSGAAVAVTPFASGGAAAVNTGAAAIELKAAVASKRHWITKWRVTNITAAEFPIAVLQDGNGSPVLHAHMAFNMIAATTAGASGVADFGERGIEVASGEAVDYALQTATGDTHSDIVGWVEV